jgi:hypothetical protein
MSLTPYHAKLLAHELSKRSSSDNVDKLASVLSDASVDLNPHQIEAALFAFRSPFPEGRDQMSIWRPEDTAESPLVARSSAPRFSGTRSGSPQEVQSISMPMTATSSQW